MNIQKPKLIPIIKIVEKLLGEEEFYRTEYMSFLLNLLMTSSMDHLLSGLSLDDLDFSDVIHTQKTPPPISPSRKNKVSDLPITWYLNTITLLDSKHKNAQLWNILAIKVAIYLIALPEIRPELFQKDHTEHINTVKRLLGRFRLANQVLTASRKHKYANDYLLLWNQLLPSPTTSLEALVTHLNQLIKDDSLDNFKKQLINDIRIPFAYAFQKRAKIAKASRETQLQSQFIDEDQLIQEFKEIPIGTKSKTLVYEKQLDDHEERLFGVDPATITPLANTSETSQRYVLPIISKHIQRKEHLLASSSLFPNLNTISGLLNELYKQFVENKVKNKACLILMLCFLTGNQTKEWMNAQKKRVKNLNSRQRLILKQNQYYLSTKFSIFENQGFEWNGLLNDTIYLDIPIPNQFIQDLRNGTTITEKELHKKLKELRSKLFIPKLSLIKVSSLLHYVIFEQTGDKQLADLLTGIDANQSSSISYCSHPITTLQMKYVTTIQKMSEKLHAHYEISLNSSLNFGSRKAPTAHVIKNIFAVLTYNIYQQAQNDWIAKLNHYSIWMWHALLLFTAARPVSEFPSFLRNFNFKRQIFFVSDKEIGGRLGDGRIVPLCDFMIDEVQKYLEFLKQVQRLKGISDPILKQYIQDIFDSKIPLLNIYQHGQWQALTPTLVQAFHPELGLDHSNWHRHTTRAFLTSKSEEPSILALFGHEVMQQEAAHPYSSLSFNHYKQLANLLQQMCHEFHISGINHHAIN